MRKALYYGDCLDVLQDPNYIAGESVDLIYLDPPFNSNRDYNVLFREETGAPAEAQVKAFTDTWKWNDDLRREWAEFEDSCPNQPLVATMQGFIQNLQRNDVTAYLARMTTRLFELHKKLKPTGSLYLHCDPSASHYLKIVLDLIFDQRNFQNEVIWWYRKWSASESRFLRNHDVIFFYAKDRNAKRTFNVQYVPLAPSTLKRFGGKRQDFADEDRTRKIATEEDSKGSYMPDVWPINLIPANSGEWLPYPTQKPIALLKRILEASSNPGDVVLDPFCGCGTTIMAAQELGRNWIGIDITSTATSLIEARLFDAFGIHNGKRGDYDIIGLPTTDAEARELADRDKHEFQKWAISLVPRAMPWQEKKGADGGVDGFVRFRFRSSSYKQGDAKSELVIISVKGGHNIQVKDIRELAEVMKANKAVMGFFVSLEQPTGPMLDWAGQQGFVSDPENAYKVPVIQCRTVGQLLRGEAFAFPWNATIQGIPKAGEGQARMFDDE